MTTMFTVSYESLLKKKYMPFIGENYPKTGNVHYLPTRSLGAHNSVLIAMLAPDKVSLANQQDAKRAAAYAEHHKDLALSPEDLLKLTHWIDTNGQFYGMYWGRKQLQYKDHPNFRPKPTFGRAVGYESLISEEQR